MICTELIPFLPTSKFLKFIHDMGKEDTRYPYGILLRLHPQDLEDFNAKAKGLAKLATNSLSVQPNVPYVYTCLIEGQRYSFLIETKPDLPRNFLEIYSHV